MANGQVQIQNLPALPSALDPNAAIPVAQYGFTYRTTPGDISALAGGTVTQVSTGTGLTGGPITTTGTVSLADTAVTPGSYTLASVTVDQQGRITSASNGAVSPAGSDTQVQYNSSGSLAGSAGLTYDAVTGALGVGLVGSGSTKGTGAIAAPDGSGTTAGTDLTISAGNATDLGAQNRNGGDVSVIAGDAHRSGTAGGITLQTGSGNDGSGTKIPGNITLTLVDPNGGSSYGALALNGAAVANGSVATALTSVGPTGSHTTVQMWLKVTLDGTVGYIPVF